MDPLKGPITEIKSSVAQKYSQDDYNECYVAFLDIMGMKNLLKKDYPDIRKIFNTIESAFTLYGNIGVSGTGNFISENQIRVTIMSDSVVISIKKETPHSFSKIIGFSSYIIKEMVDALETPVFIRGGISSGLLSHTNFCVFGPGLVNAYQLENEKANYMRCIIDKSIYNTKDFVDYLNKNTSIIKDEDNFYFIDFINDGNLKKIKEYAEKVIGAVSGRIKEKYELLFRFINIHKN